MKRLPALVSLISLTLLGLIPALGGAAASHAADAAHAIPEWSEVARPLVYRIINFVLFVGLLVVALRKPIAQALVVRKKEVEEVMKASAERKAWAEQMYADYNRRLDNIGKEVEEIRASLRKEGEEEAKRLRAHAENLAESVRKEARMMADAELEDFKSALRREVTEKAAEAARQTLMGVVNEQDDIRLGKAFLMNILANQGSKVQ